MPKTYKDLPRFEDANKGIDSTFWGPKGSVEEGRGMLNLLTPEVILQAKGEIKEGISIGLKCVLQLGTCQRAVTFAAGICRF